MRFISHKQLLSPFSDIEMFCFWQCKKMVFEYGPVIIANAEQFLEDTDVCSVLRVCTASTTVVKKDALSVVAEAKVVSDT